MRIEGYLIMERGYRLNSKGDEVRTREGDFTPWGWKQVAGTMSYEHLSGAVQKVKAIYEKSDDWGYKPDDLVIVWFGDEGSSR